MFIKMKETCRFGYGLYAKGQTYQVGEAFIKTVPANFLYEVVPAPHASAAERQAFAQQQPAAANSHEQAPGTEGTTHAPEENQAPGTEDGKKRKQQKTPKNKQVTGSKKKKA